MAAKKPLHGLVYANPRKAHACAKPDGCEGGDGKSCPPPPPITRTTQPASPEGMGRALERDCKKDPDCLPPAALSKAAWSSLASNFCTAQRKQPSPNSESTNLHGLRCKEAILQACHQTGLFLFCGRNRCGYELFAKQVPASSARVNDPLYVPARRVSASSESFSCFALNVVARNSMK